MSGAAFSQVDLDRIRIPFSVRAHHDKIQREPAYHSFFRKPPANLRGFPGNQRCISGVGRENTAEITLTGPTAEKLIVGRQQLDATQWGDSELHAGAPELVAHDSFLNYCLPFPQFLHVTVVRNSC